MYRDNEKASYFNRTIKKSCFKTQDEAREELRKRESIACKKVLLKSYERTLNDELKLGDHFIVK